jgi:hypothetical protein
MAYNPRPVPQLARGDAADLALWVGEELRNVARAFQESEQVQHEVLHVAPPKPREGMVVVADGTDWNPGQGAGQYTYIGGVWVYGNAPVVNTSLFLQKSANLSDVANVATTQDNLDLQPGVDVMAFDAQLTAVVRQNKQNANYTAVATDAEKHIYKDDGSAHNWTIPANSSVAYAIGTAITFVNKGSAGSISLIITSDTLVWLPSGGTGTRTLAINGMATALKVDTTVWVLSGVGLS